MRPGKGCASCRERHIKCVTEPGEATCTRCQEADRECTFVPKFRFRPFAHVDSGGANGQDLSYGKDQIWVPTKKHFSWVLEDGLGLEYGVPDDDSLTDTVILSKPPLASEAPRRGVPISGMLSSEATPQSPAKNGSAAIFSTIFDNEAQLSSSKTADLPDFASPASVEELSRRHDEGLDGSWPAVSDTFFGGNPDAISPTSLPTPGAIARPNISRREAYLVQHFIRKIAPWLDVCDLSSQFMHELPRRAMHRQMFLFSILALSSRHLAILTGQVEPAESSFYHSQCLRLVIEQLSGPESLYDDNLIATVVILRVYEEIEHSTDEILHLRGIDRLLRTIPTFAHSGGLGEAACWQALRQDAYVSMVRCVPPQLDLENFEQSSVFTFRDDAACANVVVLLFAKILRLAYSNPEDVNLDDWDRLTSNVDAWNERRLRLFQPIYFEDMDVHAGRPFPIMYMISPPQVAALQYYHACKIYLLLHKPCLESLSEFLAAERRRDTERDANSHLSAIVGLAESNPFVENANFIANHLLRIAGFCMTNTLQRQKALEFLGQIEKTMGWSTAPTVSLLTTQWSNLDTSNG